VPYVDWKNLPKVVRAHLEDRLRTRQLTKQDMIRLMDWVLSNPEMPEVFRCEDFGSFKLTGEGSTSKTFLKPDQACLGKQI